MRVCLISSIHPWVNPRLVKEADLLTSIGHQVFVITRRLDECSDAWDEVLLQGKSWTCSRLNMLRHHSQGRMRWFLTACQSKLALRAYAHVGTTSLAEVGYYRGFSQVLKLATAVRADLYIAHTQGALPIAARAARHHGVPYGFDCEDLLAEEASDGLRNDTLRRAILQLERAYLAGAQYVTTTSEGMSEYLATVYGIVKPRVVRNVFPLAELNGVAPPEQRVRRQTVELVWISATIGQGRGLEDVLCALPLLPEGVRLTVIGRMLSSYSKVFSTIVSQFGLQSRVSLQPVVEASGLIRTLSQFDIGLSLDGNDCLNRSLTISNKCFQYLQAGLMVAATDTPGHVEIVKDVEPALIVYRPGDALDLAEKLSPYVVSRELLIVAQQRAWQAGQQRYNWDTEQCQFLSVVPPAVSTIATPMPMPGAADSKIIKV